MRQKIGGLFYNIIAFLWMCFMPKEGGGDSSKPISFQRLDEIKRVLYGIKDGKCSDGSPFNRVSWEHCLIGEVIRDSCFSHLDFVHLSTDIRLSKPPVFQGREDFRAIALLLDIPLELAHFAFGCELTNNKGSKWQNGVNLAKVRFEVLMNLKTAIPFDNVKLERCYSAIAKQWLKTGNGTEHLLLGSYISDEAVERFNNHMLAGSRKLLAKRQSFLGKLIFA